MTKFILYGIVWLFFSLSANPQPQPTTQSKPTIWRKLPSPMAASVRSLAQDSQQVFYAGTIAGLFRSRDQGTTWQPAGLPGKVVDKILVTSNGTLLAGCYRQGLWRSGNQGQSWQPVGLQKNVYLFALVENTAHVLWATAAYSTGSPTPIQTGLFTSRDDGQSWQPTALTDSTLVSVSSPQSGLLIASGSRDSYRSTDEGHTWSSMKQTGLPDSIPISSVISHNKSLIASIGNRQDASGQGGGGIYRSQDGGQTWRRSDEGLQRDTKVNNLCRYKHNVLAGTGFLSPVGDKGVFQSTDGGQSWQLLGLKDKIIREVRVTAKGQLMAATEESVIFMSSDAGNSWQQIGKGIDSWETYKVQAHKNMLFVDGWRTSNQGTSWKKIEPLGGDFVITKNGCLLTFRAGQMKASNDNGESWHTVSAMNGENAFMNVLADNTVVACIGGGGGVWYSRDEGTTWHRYALAGFETMDMRVVGLTARGTLLLSSGRGTLLRSTDAGKSWRQVAAISSWGFASVGDTIYAGTYAKGVYKSVDDGLSWTLFNAGLRWGDEYVTVSWLTVGNDESILCSTLGKGMWLLPKGSQRWQAYSEGLGEQLNFWTSYTDANQRVYVAGPGVFVRQVN